MENYIKREMLAELQRAGAAVAYTVAGSEHGLFIQVEIGADTRILQTALGETRYFKTLDAVASTLVSLGVADAQLKLGVWKPKKIDRS
uniref:hypothetical protein n=1 Tax=Sulfuriferula sp. GW6 TaxID=3345112 RepID=UPI0039F6FD11